MARIVPAEDLRAHLGKELDALKGRQEVYITKRGRLAGVLVEPNEYAELLERLDYLEDSLAALQARDEGDAAVPWSEVRA
jgi:antitoxin Phd